MNPERKITFWAAVLMSINIIVGGGVFAGPQSMTAIAGSLSFSAWLISAILVFPLVWGIAKAPALFPGPGGFYNYVKHGLNEDFGFLAQWCYLLGYIMGTASAMTTLLRLGMASRLGVSFAVDHPYITNALILLLFSLLNLMPLGIVSRLQAGATLLKLVPLFIVTVLTLSYINPAIEYDMSQISLIPLTIPTVIFGYLGFEVCCSLSNLLKDGPGSAGKVVLTAFFITAVLYMIFHFGLLQIMGVDSLAAEGAIAFPAYLGLDPGLMATLGIVIMGAILLSYANSLFGISLSNINNIMRLSNGGQLYAAIINGASVWLLLCFMSDIRNIFAFTVFGVGVSYALTLVAVFRRSIQLKKFGLSFLMFLGFFSCAIMFYYCWTDLGGSVTDRLLNLSPLFSLAFLGFLVYKFKFLKLE